jgi:hypothetical protein
MPNPSYLIHELIWGWKMGSGPLCPVAALEAGGDVEELQGQMGVTASALVIGSALRDSPNADRSGRRGRVNRSPCR